MKKMTIKEAFLTKSFENSIIKMFSLKMKIKDFLYKIKCFFLRKTTIKPRYLPHTWVDKDAILQHMMFEILSKFIEEECSPGCVEWYGEYAHKIVVNDEEVYVRDELQNLYDWWHDIFIPYTKGEDERSLSYDKELEKDIRPFDEFLKDINTPKEEKSELSKYIDSIYMEMNKYEQEMYDELESRMIRLVKVHRYMWT